MPRRVAAVMQAELPSIARKFLRSTMVTGGYHALLQMPEQSFVDPVYGCGFSGAGLRLRLRRLKQSVDFDFTSDAEIDTPVDDDGN